MSQITSLQEDEITRLRQQLDLATKYPAVAQVIVLTYQECAWFLKCGPKTIRRYIVEGHLEARYMGGRHTPRVGLLELVRFVEDSPQVAV